MMESIGSFFQIRLYFNERMSRYVKQLACRFHPDAILVEDSRAGDMICPQCGLVVGDRMIDVGSEWRTFSNDKDAKDMSRVGGVENPLLDGENLETVMSAGTGAAAVDEFGKQKYTSGPRQMSTSDRALKSGFDAIRQMANRISLSNRIVQKACSLYKQSYENKCVRGRSQDGVVATCIYIACRQENAQRTIKEICAISNTTSKKEIGRIFKQIIRSLPNNRTESLEIKNLVPRFCSQLDLLQQSTIQRAAIHIVERAKEICNIQSRAPDSVAGAAIFMACAAAGQKKSMKEIQEVAGAQENTIRTIYRLLLPCAEKLFPADFAFQCPPANLPQS